MGQPTKKSDRGKGWHRPNLKRRENSRPERVYILIVCEGERTEPLYFRSLAETLPPNSVQVTAEGIGDNTLSLVKRAFKIWHNTGLGNLGRIHDQLWVVFDRDSFPADQFDNAIKSCEANSKAASEPGTAVEPSEGERARPEPSARAAWSNEAFELWYVLHFTDRVTAVPRKEFKAELTRRFGEAYVKNDPEIYRKLQKLGDEAEAIRRAKRMHGEFTAANQACSKSNPCTTVFQLVEELNKYRI